MVLAAVLAVAVAASTAPGRSGEVYNQGFKVNPIKLNLENLGVLSDSNIDFAKQQDAPPTLPNIQYTGNGYDVVAGNPQTTNAGGDPGFLRQQVFQTVYSGATTGDQRWSIPDGYTVNQARTCSLSSTISDVFGESSYFSSLATSVSVSGGASIGSFGGSFSASTDYKRVRNTTQTNHRVAFEAKAVCTEYNVQLETFAPPKFTANFANAITRLSQAPSDTNLAASIINSFGTHAVVQAEMGARCVLQSIFTQDTYTTMTDTSFSFTVGAKASFGIFSGSTSTMTQDEVQAGKTYNAQRTEIYQSFIGKFPPTDGNVTQWAASVADAPYPYQYTLTPLSDLVDPVAFPQLEAAKVLAAQTTLRNTIATWCRVAGGFSCDGRQPDPPAFLTQVTTNSAKDQVTFTCPIGVPISVGMSDRHNALEVNRSSWAGNPAYVIRSTTTVECWAPSEVIKCNGLCTTSVSSLYLVYQPDGAFAPGVQTATCPANYVVTSCGYTSNSGSNVESYPYSYPASATSCKCYNYWGVQCVASCVPARDAPSHQIVSVYNKGVFQVSCPAGKHLLGCGYNPSNSDREVYWRVAPVSKTACECYNYFGATCFAICSNYI